MTYSASPAPATRWWSDDAGTKGSTIDPHNPAADAAKLHPSQQEYCAVLRQTVAANQSLLPETSATDPAMAAASEAFVAEVQRLAPSGISGQWPGRVGDTPVLGAGTFADDASVAISTTGQGEFFARGVVAKDVADRVELAGASLADACAASIGRHLAGRGGYGGVIALQPSGAAVLAFNSAGMFRGRAVGGAVTTWV